MPPATNWDDLRLFLAVCREGSVKRAGTRLGVSHTTVLRRIRAFEERLDNDEAREIERALEEIGRITRARLELVLEQPDR